MMPGSIQRPVKPHIPFDTIGQDSLCPAPHPLPSQHLPQPMNTQAFVPPTLPVPATISAPTALKTVGQDSPFPAPRPPHPPQTTNPLALSVPAVDSAPAVMQLDLKTIPPHELAGLVSLGESIAPHSPTHSAGEDPGSEASPGSVIIVSGMYSSHKLLCEELTLQCRLRYCSRYHFDPQRPTRTGVDRAIGADSWYGIGSGGMAEDRWWLLGAPSGGETWSACRCLALSPSPPNQAALEAHREV